VPGQSELPRRGKLTTHSAPGRLTFYIGTSGGSAGFEERGEGEGKILQRLKSRELGTARRGKPDARGGLGDITKTGRDLNGHVQVHKLGREVLTRTAIEKRGNGVKSDREKKSIRKQETPGMLRQRKYAQGETATEGRGGGRKYDEFRIKVQEGGPLKKCSGRKSDFKG